MIKSNIKKMADQKGITNPSDLAHSAWIAWSTAKKMLKIDAKISGVPLETLVKVAGALHCNIDDLFEVSDDN